MHHNTLCAESKPAPGWLFRETDEEYRLRCQLVQLANVFVATGLRLLV